MPCAYTDPECLRKAATHISHDIRMLRRAWSNRNESLAYTGWFIFCRSLMDFFLDEGRTHPDSIYAWHYFDSRTTWDVMAATLPKPDTYGEYREAANKLVAHLAYRRVDFADKHRDLKPSQEITEYLLGLTILFVRGLPQDRASWFGGLLLD